MTGASAAWQRRLRVPGGINVAASLVLVLVVLLIAVPAHQQGPPQIAEFAPQAQQTIKQAPQEQSSFFGKNGTANVAGGGPLPAPTPSGLPPDATLHHCVGDPPRQIEDPQSPPCVAYWSGNNGGATSMGVTGDTITISMASSLYLPNAPSTQDLINFFNSRFEFYHRKLVLAPPFTRSDTGCDNTGYGTGCNSTGAMYADAQTVAAQKPFAELGYGARGNGDGSEYYFYDQLAQRHILSVGLSSKEGGPFTNESHYDQYAPYEWNYLPALDDDLNAMGSFICTQLANRPPAYAGLPTSNASKRKFGVLVQSYQTALAPNVQPLVSAASACGQSLDVVQFQNSQAGQVNGLLQLKTDMVTSIVCICNSLALAEDLFPAASNQAYYPEWLIQNYGVQDDDFLMAFYAESTTPSETQHAFGLMGFNKWLPGASMPVTWAEEDENPAAGCPAACYNWELWAAYWDLLVIASGIQMAGPNLTPATFQSGLFRTTFPNPGCGGPPYYQACVGFGPHDHTMVQDYAMVWWNNQAVEPFYFEGATAPGAYCYIGLGRRFHNNWPTAPEPLFDPRAPCQ